MYTSDICIGAKTVAYIQDQRLNQLLDEYKVAFIEKNQLSMLESRRMLEELINQDQEEIAAEKNDIIELQADTESDRQDKTARLEKIKQEHQCINASIALQKKALEDEYQEIQHEQNLVRKRNLESGWRERSEQLQAYTTKQQEIARRQLQQCAHDIELCHGRRTQLRERMQTVCRRENQRRSRAKKVELNIKIIEAEYELGELQKPSSQPDEDAKDVGFKNNIISKFLSLSKLYYELAQEFCTNTVEEMKIRLDVTLRSHELESSALNFQEEQEAEDFFALADHFEELSREYLYISKPDKVSETRMKKVQSYKDALTHAKDERKKAEIYFKIAYHYYNEALRRKYSEPNNLGYAYDSFDEHEKFLDKARQADARASKSHSDSEDDSDYKPISSVYRFLDRKMFFEQCEPDLFHAIENSFYAWFSPVDLITALVRFNWDCNHKLSKVEPEDMLAESYRKFCLVFRKQNLPALLELDKKIRKSKSFYQFMDKMTFLYINPETFSHPFTMESYKKFNYDLAKELGVQENPAEYFEMAMPGYMQAVFSKCSGLVQRMLDALKQELERRGQAVESYPLKTAIELDQSLNPNIPIYLQRGLLKIINKFITGDLEFCETRPVEVQLDIPADDDRQVPENKVNI